MQVMSVGRKHYEAIKTFVYKLDEGKCHICGGKVSYDDVALDHVIPKAVSGRGNTETSDEYWNLRLAHKNCNAARGAARTPGQLRLPINEAYRGGMQYSAMSRM